MAFSPERLQEIRTSLNINKSEAARMLNLSPMGYWRYENGERIPSYQMICFMAQTFHCSYEYLCCETDDPSPTAIVVSKKDDPILFEIIKSISDDESGMRKRMISYYGKIKTLNGKQPE